MSEQKREPKLQINGGVPMSTWKALDELSRRTGVSRSQHVGIAVIEYIDRQTDTGRRQVSGRKKHDPSR